MIDVGLWEAKAGAGVGVMMEVLTEALTEAMTEAMMTKAGVLPGGGFYGWALCNLIHNIISYLD